MDDWLKNATPDAWYKVVAYAGALAFVAAIGATNVPGVFVSLGLLAIGSGEWASRIREPVRASNGQMGLVQKRVIRPTGVILDLVGALFLAYGLYLLVKH